VKVRFECQQLLTNATVTGRKLSQLLGRLQAGTKVILLAPLFFRILQRALKRTLEETNQDYSASLTLSEEERGELQWWIDYLSVWNRKTLLKDKPDQREVGPSVGRHLCLQADHPAEEILQLETRSGGEALNAFSQDWSRLEGLGYANPPWNLISRVLSRVRQQKATVILITPVWKCQPWHLTLLEVMVDAPVLLPFSSNLIIPTHPEDALDVVPQLAARVISSNITRTEEGTELLLASCQQKSSKAYDSLFQKWVEWCSEHDSDPISGPIGDVVNIHAHFTVECFATTL
jgi:hypothetical protein